MNAKNALVVVLSLLAFPAKIGAFPITEVVLLPSSSLILETALDGLTRHSQGKVRDIYAFPEDPAVLLIVATDRISAFDYVLGSGIPDKGKVLNQLSAFWFAATSDIVSLQANLKF